MIRTDPSATAARGSAPARAGRAAAAAVIALIVAVPLALVLVLGDRGDEGWAVTPADAAGLDRWMAHQAPGAPLVGLGHVLVAEGARAGIDPRALAAIARHESVLGGEGSGADVNNAFGWGPAIPFGSWEEGIATVARGLAEGYVAEGRATLARIQPVWAPVGAANDPGGLNRAWLEGVARHYAELGGDPARPITLEGQTGPPPRPWGPDRLVPPTGGAGVLGGGPGEGTHAEGVRPHGWESDRAVDVELPLGSPLYAVDDGVVTGVAGDPADLEGRFGGARLTLVADDDRYFYAHMAAVAVAEGERVRAGRLIGFSGAASGVEHLHLGVMRRHPVAVAALGRGDR